MVTEHRNGRLQALREGRRRVRKGVPPHPALHGRQQTPHHLPRLQVRQRVYVVSERLLTLAWQKAPHGQCFLFIIAGSSSLQARCTKPHPEKEKEVLYAPRTLQGRRIVPARTPLFHNVLAYLAAHRFPLCRMHRIPSVVLQPLPLSRALAHLSCAFGPVGPVFPTRVAIRAPTSPPAPARIRCRRLPGGKADSPTCPEAVG